MVSIMFSDGIKSYSQSDVMQPRVSKSQDLLRHSIQIQRVVCLQWVVDSENLPDP